MKILLLALAAVITSGCNSIPDASFGPGLLHVDSMMRISNSTDRMQGLEPFLRLSPSQLHRLIGKPDLVEIDSNGFADHHYYRDHVDFSFTFHGSDMTTRGYSPIPRFSHPQMAITNYTTTNPFMDHSVTSIAYMVFRSSSSPVRGLYFVTRSREAIESLYSLMRTVTNEDVFIPMCGNLTGIEFVDKDEKAVVGFTVNADGSTIVTSDGEGFYDKSVVSLRKDVALACFELMRANAPEVLREIAHSTDRCVQEFVVPNFPFGELGQ